MTVVCYGLGMALALFGAAYALLRLRDRIASLQRLERLRPYTAKMTAALLLLVGIGLAVRSLCAFA